MKRQHRFLGVSDIRLILSELAPELPQARRGRVPTFRFNGRQGVRLLESALATPRQTFQGRYLHHTIFDKAAALFRSLANNHALLEGNKPLAFTAAIVFLNLNEYVFYAPREESVAFVRRATRLGEKPPLRDLSRWFRRHSYRADAFLKLPEERLAHWLAAPGADLEEKRHLLHALVHQASELVKESKERKQIA